jgi:beta-galactosidase
MRPDVGLDYWKFAEHVDVACWDSYPEWHVNDDVETAILTGFYHDLHRSYKGGKPFYLIESSPSQTNWQPLSRLKRPGLLKLASAQALAHGAMGVNYFQWRQSRGGEEKFHGAVVGHRGGAEARVFREVEEVGKLLSGMPDLAAARTPARVALIYDFENEWVLNLAYLPRKAFKEYQGICVRHYACFWRMGFPVDLVSSRADLSGYALVVAPMLHMLTTETAERLAGFVQSGGTLVTTFLTGWVGESDLVHRGDYPEPIGRVLGLAMVEFDTFGPEQHVRIEPAPDNALGLTGTGTADRYAELLEPRTAQTLAVYAGAFYRGTPALTVNSFGEGMSYHIGAHTDEDFLRSFYRRIAASLETDLGPIRELPEGVSIRIRETSTASYLFALNFKSFPQPVHLAEPGWIPVDGGEPVREIVLPGFGINILKQAGNGAGR